MIHSITSIPRETRTILVRLDLNVPMNTKNEVTDTLRIDMARQTIDYLAKHHEKIYLLSHGNGSLSNLAPICESLWEIPVSFGGDCLNPKSDGKIVLLENIRFYPEEMENSLDFAKKLASIADVFVNEAFSCSHRAHASIDAITKFLPSYAGFNLQEEISYIERIFHNPRKPIMGIIGGAKISTKLPLLHHLAEKMDSILLGGAMSNTFLVARGYDIGCSLYEPSMLEEAKKLDESGKFILPIDVMLEEGGVVSIDSISQESRVLDIGPETLSMFNDVLQDAKTVIWNGPVGLFEKPPFNSGTFGIIRILQSLHDTCVVAGGGDTAAAFNSLPIGISFLSTGGGAFLQALEGRPLPGIVALDRSF